jgi:hypothetical protein
MIRILKGDECELFGGALFGDMSEIHSGGPLGSRPLNDLRRFAEWPRDCQDHHAHGRGSHPHRCDMSSRRNATDACGNLALRSLSSLLCLARQAIVRLCRWHASQTV